jgi:hypothetical protein
MRNFIKKYRVIIIIGAIVLVIVGGAFIISITNRSSNNNQGSSNTTVDPDTGEAIDISDRSPENNGGNNSGVAVLGIDSLSRVPDASISTQQIQAIRDDLATKAINSLPGHGDTLKIITPLFDTTTYNIVANLKYNDTNNYAKIYIALNAPSYVSYYIVLNNNTIYKSGNIPVSY